MYLRPLLAMILVLCSIGCTRPPDTKPRNVEVSPPLPEQAEAKAAPELIAFIEWDEGYRTGRRRGAEIAIWSSGLVIWASPIDHAYCAGYWSVEQMKEAQQLISNLYILKERDFGMAAFDAASMSIEIRHNNELRRFAVAGSPYLEYPDSKRKQVDMWLKAREVLINLRPRRGELLTNDSEEAKLLWKDVRVKSQWLEMR